VEFWNCKKLKSVTILSSQPPILGSGVFSEFPIERIFLPEEAVDTYKTNFYWKKFAKMITSK